jgi:hypothetical protein
MRFVDSLYMASALLIFVGGAVAYQQGPASAIPLFIIAGALGVGAFVATATGRTQK